MYFEDADLAARARAAGARVAYRPAARVLHDVQGSSGGGGGRPSPSALYFWTRNRGRFIARNAPDPVRRAVAHAYTLGTRFVRMGQAGLAGRGGEVRLIARALIDGYLRRATGDTFPRSGVARPRPADEARV
jgi:GT2 family glycosyltransferase